MKEPWELTSTQWCCLPILYGEGPYWAEFHKAIMARCNFDEAVAAASRLKASHASLVRHCPPPIQPVSPRPGPKQPVHAWTEADEDLVRTEYDGTGKSKKVLAGKIGVTPDAIRGKVTKLKVSRNRQNSWTDAEKDALRAEYDGTRASINAIAAKLKRTQTAVKSQVQTLKLAQKLHRNWSDAEKEYLEANYGIVPDKQICEYLKRSRNAIVIAAKHIGIQRKTNFYTARDIGKLLGLSDAKIITETWRQRGYIQTRKSPTRCGRNHMWLFTEKDVSDCLRERPWLVEIKKMKPGAFRKIVEQEWGKDPWYTTAQAAPLLGVHFHTVVKYLNHGLLAGVKKPALCWQGEWVIRRSAIFCFMEKQREERRSRLENLAIWPAMVRSILNRATKTP